MEAAEGFEAHSTYAKPVAAHALPSFTISESYLGMGASLGNTAVWIHTKGTGAIERVFLNEAGVSMVGAVALRYGAHARGLSSEHRPYAGDSAPPEYSAMYPEAGSRTFEVHPAFQRVHYTLANVIQIEETTFVPLGEVPPEHFDDPAVYVHVRIRNTDRDAHHVRIVGSAMLCGQTRPDIVTRYDERARALVAFNASNPNLVRVFGLSETPAAYGSDFDLASSYDFHVHPLRNSLAVQGDVIGRLQVDLSLNAGEQRDFYFTVALYARGEEQALDQYHKIGPAPQALEKTRTHLQEVISRGQVITPDAVINHGALWSKVNMRRVMAVYPTGCGFTNDPGKYANIVVRDCAWFVYGNDHFFPLFSRTLLENIASHQYSSGKMPEYFDGVTGRVEDDGLNINDDTPLYILAVNHHFRATGDVPWLRTTYASVARAARYIISQIDERGLVCCTANDPRGEVWAIAGWRNIIPGYTINGAVTEINAECVAALRAAAHLADNLGGFDQDKADFAAAAASLKDAINAQLINADSGLYYLNIDIDGNAHTDVTGDEIFPVIMRVCDDDVGFRIISRLNFPDFWTAAGLRTVSRLDPRYEPSAYSGLLGGVWPGLTWWFAFGAARYHPEMMVRALRSSFEHYGSAPKRNNTVPGQFSEWFDGESLENRGMRLSPWEPPRFLWAAIEGVCGLMLSPGTPRINPLIPADWNWVGLRNLPYHGSLLSYFLVRERESGFRVYSTMPVDSDWDVVVYGKDISDHIRIFSNRLVAIGLAREDGMAILLGNCAPQTVISPIIVADEAPASSRFNLRTYNSERGAWEEGGVISTTELHGTVISIEANGFRLIELSLVKE
jgi:hypothetical protein